MPGLATDDRSLTALDELDAWFALMPLVVGIGEILWDRYPDGDHLGGAPANFAFHAAQMSAESFVVSRVGKDTDGEKLLEVMARNGLSRRFIQMDSDQPTGVVEVKLNKSQPSYLIHSAAWDYLEITDSLKALASRADAICFGTLVQRNSISQKAIQEFIRHSRTDAIRFFDLNLRQSFYNREIIEQGLLQATVLKLNEDELDLLPKILGCRKEETLDLIWKQYQISMIALTLGAQGCELYTPLHRIKAPPFPCTCVNAVGAGDAFSATLVMGLLKKMPLEEIVKWANRVGSYVASQSGAMPCLPEELRIFRS